LADCTSINARHIATVDSELFPVVSGYCPEKRQGRRSSGGLGKVGWWQAGQGIG
jgi:hypothetical protein